MTELGGRELLHEWQKAMDSVVSRAVSVGGATGIPRQLLEPMQRQVELLHELVEQERRLQRQMAGRVLAPFDAVFELLEQSGQMMRSQAEALQSAGKALEETARLAGIQADLFERALGAMREPTELAKSAMGIKQPARRRQAPKKPSRRKPA